MRAGSASSERIFMPVRHEGGFLVDGGLVNPVPVSLSRAMGADIVIAVDLGSDILGRRTCLQRAWTRSTELLTSSSMSTHGPKRELEGEA